MLKKVKEYQVGVDEKLGWSLEKEIKRRVALAEYGHWDENWEWWTPKDYFAEQAKAIIKGYGLKILATVDRYIREEEKC